MVGAAPHGALDWNRWSSGGIGDDRAEVNEDGVGQLSAERSADEARVEILGVHGVQYVRNAPRWYDEQYRQTDMGAQVRPYRGLFKEVQVHTAGVLRKL